MFVLDLLGWGRSSRPTVHNWFSKHKYKDDVDVELSVARDARRFWVASLENWRQQVGNICFSLLRHHAWNKRVTIPHCVLHAETLRIYVRVKYFPHAFTHVHAGSYRRHPDQPNNLHAGGALPRRVRGHLLRA